MQDDSLNTAMLNVFGKSTVLEAPTKVFMQRQWLEAQQCQFGLTT